MRLDASEITLKLRERVIGEPPYER
jgi:hypothetical protein